MGHRSEPALLVLHVLRLKGLAEANVVTNVSGLAGEVVTNRLVALASEGLVSERIGRISGYSLTAEGRVEHGRLLAADLAAAGCRDRVHDAYTRFLGLNEELLALCTAWQLRPSRGAPVVNDHSDPDYDRSIVERLSEIDDDAQSICADLGRALARLDRYGSGLATARERVEAGQAEYLTGPLIPSYHTLWFELHEDLLVTLGIPRRATPA